LKRMFSSVRAFRIGACCYRNVTAQSVTAVFCTTNLLHLQGRSYCLLQDGSTAGTKIMGDIEKREALPCVACAAGVPAGVLSTLRPSSPSSCVSTGFGVQTLPSGAGGGGRFGRGGVFPGDEVGVFPRMTLDVGGVSSCEREERPPCTAARAARCCMASLLAGDGAAGRGGGTPEGRAPGGRDGV